MSTKLTFGLDVPATVFPAGPGPADLTRTAEALGYDLISVSDHPAGTAPTNETWTMLAFAAAATTRIGLMTRVLGVPFRPPALVAKMAETLDRLSGGRLVLGLGGGASDDEIREFGLPVPTPGEKIAGLEDATRVIRGLWTETAFTFAGARYRTDAADISPRPERHIPIWYGTYGPRALDLTGRLADGWIPSLGYVPAERLPALRDAVLAAAERAGRPRDAVTCALNLEVHLDNAMTPSDDIVAGPAHAVAERLAQWVAQGFTTFNIKVTEGAGRAKQVERIATEVLPLLRG